ncbi:MAG: ABC transporter ATP-binding protein [Thermincola sp.]|jgi:putative ABC transport system ATP-binding protein|nr:ABC transporter ATP-binding protein [Thermincola sp.]
MSLKAEGLTKIYGKEQNEVIALNNATVTIGEGEFVSIIGPSGSGKSTLLHLLSGIDQPTKGKVFIGEKDLYTLNEKELSAFRRRSFGFIFQQFNLIPILTAEENISMPVLLDRKQPDKEYLKELSDLLGISNRLTHLPHELSGGQQQRVAIARALIAKPDIIFADEPTGNLDSKSGKEVMELLTNTSKQLGKTLVVITHDDRIARLADRQFSIIDGLISEVE